MLAVDVELDDITEQSTICGGWGILRDHLGILFWPQRVRDATPQDLGLSFNSADSWLSLLFSS